jgi:hypothetical protein
MAARSIRNLRQSGSVGHEGMGRPIQVARPPTMGKPVISPRPMIRPVQPANLRQPVLTTGGAPVSAPAGMPPVLQGPQQVNPAGPQNVQPLPPSAPTMRV